MGLIGFDKNGFNRRRRRLPQENAIPGQVEYTRGCKHPPYGVSRILGGLSKSLILSAETLVDKSSQIVQVVAQLFDVAESFRDFVAFSLGVFELLGQVALLAFDPFPLDKFKPLGQLVPLLPKLLKRFGHLPALSFGPLRLFS